MSNIPVLPVEAAHVGTQQSSDCESEVFGDVACLFEKVRYSLLFLLLEPLLMDSSHRLTRVQDAAEVCVPHPLQTLPGMPFGQFGRGPDPRHPSFGGGGFYPWYGGGYFPGGASQNGVGLTPQIGPQSPYIYPPNPFPQPRPGGCGRQTWPHYRYR